jgi:lysyl-tRNA synthetase class 2
MDVELLRERGAIIREVREFFHRRSYLEVDTPLLAPDLIPESCLEVFETRRILPGGNRSLKEKPYWLIPSPEIWMKRLIARHRVDLFQICKAFRNGESSGGIHSPEFTMLEYYTMDADYRDSLALTEELFACLGASRLPFPVTPFRRETVEEAFLCRAGFSPLEAAERGTLREEACRLGLDPPASLDNGALYDLIFIQAVEPSLGREEPTVLLDYPAFVPCLAKKNLDGRTVERWELYYRGVELANCYTEEGDPEEVRRFFQSEAAAKEENALVPHRVDGDYWKIFEGFPPCSGVALGLDRLILVLLGKSRIDSVLPFPMEG